MTKKILMVYPKYPDTFWSFNHILHFIKKKATYPPLGLLTVASMLPKEWEIKLIDINVSELTDEQIQWADMVMISAMLVQSESAKEVIRRSKDLGKIVVAGGPAFTAQHEQFKDVDHFVLGEGEITVPLFVEDIQNGKAKQMYTTTERPAITSTPIPRWDLINTDHYVNLMIQYSRGCPFNCEFCDIVIMNGRKPRTKTPDQILGELKAIYDTGWRNSVFFVDDNFIGNKLNVKKLLPKMIEWQKKHKYPFKFLTEASINLADDLELMDLMCKSNFYKVFLGFESPDTGSLKECGKLQNLERDITESVKIIHRNGMQVMGGFIVGFDNDNESIFNAQIKFIQQIGVVTAMVGVLTALPQTRLWHRLKKEGRLLGESSGNNTAAYVNFIPKMGKERLLEGYKEVLSNLYSPKQYFRRINTLIKNYRPTVRSRLAKGELGALFKSVWKVGIRSRARWQYWKLILRTTFTNIRAFPVAIELSICWLHYERIVRLANSA